MGETAVKKTIAEWERELNVRVIDPDGFDRSDPDLYKRKFTSEEFRRGVMTSTCQFLVGYTTRPESPGPMTLAEYEQFLKDFFAGV